MNHWKSENILSWSEFTNSLPEKRSGGYREWCIITIR